MNPAESQFRQEVQRGDRFEFGRNWASFLETLNDDRIREAEASLRSMLNVESLSGVRFLDIGSGSGLFSLAARRLGADVTSFDYDPNSVGCTQALRDRFFPSDGQWRIERGSILDEGYVGSLGAFDVVYSWGVLHHTGHMWKALENASTPVKTGGKLFVALYNDQGFRSTFWRAVKKRYCSGPAGRALMLAVFFPYFFLRAVAKSLVTMRNEFSSYKSNRGMSLVHDWYDWLGGYPFEVASAEAVRKFFEARGFSLNVLKTTRSWGNNEFVFTRR